ncbi:MAG: transporter substrate-binding domain-containing protein [Chloroflexi bacterium]|nr:transporter substrate-binding domain-containing protein [Chloroflexota bacterium]
MKRILSPALLFLGFLAAALGGMAQDQTAVPTLRVPTLVPTAMPQAPRDALLSSSSVAEIAEQGELRAGVLFNDPPYSELSLQGEVRGFDVEVLRLMAETWEVDLKLVQVTRQNAIEQLEAGDVHVVASALVHYRELGEEVEFTQTYLTGRQGLMVRADSAYASPSSLIIRKIGFVLGTRAETALGHWEARREVALDKAHYLTLDKAMAALSRGEVEAVIGEEQDLLQVSQAYADAFRILEEPVLVEAHALAVRRQDASLRNLLNRSIQYLIDGGQLEVLFREYFPGQDYHEEILQVWQNLGDRPQPGQFPREINYPAFYTTPRVLQTGILRVGGLIDDAGSLAQGEIKLARLNRDLVEEIARRWGVSVEWVSGDIGSAFAQLQNGELDLVVGVMPDWRRAGTVDYAAPYLLHGDRLMVPANSRISGFNDLRGQWIGIMIDDETARDRAQAWADSINASVQFYQTRAADAALNILEFDNADAIYANSLALIPHLEASPNALKLTERWYSRSYYAFAVRHNDLDFRLLVEYTVQELIIDETLRRLSAPLLLSDESLAYFVVPGAPSFAGINLSGS